VSTDDSRAIAVAAGTTVLALTERGGAPAARNAGAKAAASPWLLIVDTDCYVDAPGFAKAVGALERPSDTAGLMAVFSRTAPPGPFAGFYKNYFRHLEIASMRNPPPTFTSSCFLIRRDAYLAVGGFDERFGTLPTEDAEFNARFSRAGYVMRYLVEFAFTHDKPMSLARLLREDRQRGTMITLNMSGRLGEANRGWTVAEQAVWGLEIASGTVALALPVALVVGAPAPLTITALALVTFVTILRAKLVAAWRDRGAVFAVRLFAYRALEMAAAAAGILTAVGTMVRSGLRPIIKAR
jgi:hypothetical protein